MNCIICDDNITQSSIEHIIPESLGNTSYFLNNGIVCNNCNTRFSEFEEKAITRSFLSMIRIQNGIKTKKGKPSSLKIGDIKAIGDKDFKNDIIEFTRLDDKDVQNFDPKTGVYNVTFSEFDKTEMSASKLLLKMGFEAMFKSQKAIFNKYSFNDLKQYLLNKNNQDWPFISSKSDYYNFKSVPTFNDKHNLNKIKSRLGFIELSSDKLLFRFQYDYYLLTINLTSRDYDWTSPYLINDTTVQLYPKYLVHA